MGKSTIEWTDYTFNPWIGCTKVSPGYAHDGQKIHAIGEIAFDHHERDRQHAVFIDHHMFLD